MRNFNFFIPPDLDGRLRAESDRTGMPMSEIVRRAINRYLDRKRIRRERRRAAGARTPSGSG